MQYFYWEDFPAFMLLYMSAINVIHCDIDYNIYSIINDSVQSSYRILLGCPGTG